MCGLPLMKLAMLYCVPTYGQVLLYGTLPSYVENVCEQLIASFCKTAIFWVASKAISFHPISAFETVTDSGEMSFCPTAHNFLL